MTTSKRSAIAIAAATVLLAACSEIPSAPGTPQYDVRDPAPAQAHTIAVTVITPGRVIVPDVLVTATNTVTGEYVLRFTNVRGMATFQLPNGPYVFHVRNLSDAGPVFDELGGLQLALAPLPEGQPILNTANTQAINRVSALYTPTGSIPLTPENYSALTQQPPVVLSGPYRSHSIVISFLTGATVSCNLLDSSGQPIETPSEENVFMIMPVDPRLPMPPVPQALQALGLPRGILTTATTVTTGGGECSVAGIAQTPAGGLVIETNTVTLNGEDKVFISAVDITAAQASGGATISALMMAEPRRAFTHYITEPFGDSPAFTDLGLVTGGWVAENGGATDEFVLAARFRGAGHYTAQISFTQNDVQKSYLIKATCFNGRCTFNTGGSSTLPPGLLLGVEGSVINRDGLETGTAIWRLNLPGITEVDVRVVTGKTGAEDSAPDGTAPVRMHKGGNGNTWIIPS